MITLAIYFIVAVTVWDIDWMPMLADLGVEGRFAISFIYIFIFAFDFLIARQWWEDL